MSNPSLFSLFLAELEQRHLADLRFSDVTRALRALSSAYVERRTTALAESRALDGAGKRAAFALYYGPLHFLLIDGIVRELAPHPPPGVVVDLGCGTGVAGAAVASHAAPPPRVLGFDTHPWTLDEARFTYRALGLDGEVRRAPIARVRLPRDTSFVVAAFVINELQDEERAQALAMLLAAIRRGVAVLVVEPISHRISPWWPEWAAAVRNAGGRDDEWHLRVDQPPLVKRLAQAAGLRPQVLTARSLFAGPTTPRAASSAGSTPG